MNIRFHTDTIRPMTDWLMRRKQQNLPDEAELREILRMPDYEVEFRRYGEPGLPVCGISFEEAVDFFMNFDRKEFDNLRLQYKKDSFFVSDSFKDALSEYGYVLIARSNPRFDKLIDQIPGDKKKVLSMWNGYVKESTDAYNENLAKSLDDDFDYMHTSGHIDMADLREFFRLLHPKAIIPIHTENPEEFAKEFGNEWKIIVMKDGDCFSGKG